MKRSLFTLFVLVLFVRASTAGLILITEIVTDPQLDHSESAGGNNAPYDQTPGHGTVSSVDEFVELYNAGPEPLDLTGFTLRLLDTSPSTYVFGTTTTGVLLFSAGSSLTSLLADGFVLLGNPPGAMNNGITIEINDSSGTTLDSVTVKNGAARHAGEESIARLWGVDGITDRFARDSFTPLAASNVVYVPESPVLALLVVSALAGVGAATSRRVRHARSRRRPTTLRPGSCLG